MALLFSQPIVRHTYRYYKGKIWILDTKTSEGLFTPHLSQNDLNLKRYVSPKIETELLESAGPPACWKGLLYEHWHTYAWMLGATNYLFQNSEWAGEKGGKANQPSFSES